MSLKILLIFIFSSLSVSTYAQRDSVAYANLRIVSDTIRMNGYTYICDTIGSTHINLFNAENHPGRGEVSYKDGSQIPFEQLINDNIEAVVITDELDRRMWQIVDLAFTKEQASTFDKWHHNITLNISSEDGSITDVYFGYTNLSNYSQIPIEVYRDIELQLKDEVKFELTEEGRKLNYCFLSWSQIPNGKVSESNEDNKLTSMPDVGGSGDTVIPHRGQTTTTLAP